VAADEDGTRSTRSPELSAGDEAEKEAMTKEQKERKRSAVERGYSASALR